MSLRGESNDRSEFDSTKQSHEIELNLNGLLRRPSGTPRNDPIERFIKRIEFLLTIYERLSADQQKDGVISIMTQK
jgi:hypothetical protein